MEIILQMLDDTFITPSNIEIEGYHIIGKDDKMVITLPKGVTNEAVEDINDTLSKFIHNDDRFIIFSNGFKITVLKKEDE